MGLSVGKHTKGNMCAHIMDVLQFLVGKAYRQSSLQCVCCIPSLLFLVEHTTANRMRHFNQCPFCFANAFVFQKAHAHTHHSAVRCRWDVSACQVKAIIMHFDGATTTTRIKAKNASLFFWSWHESGTVLESSAASVAMSCYSIDERETNFKLKYMHQVYFWVEVLSHSS